VTTKATAPRGNPKPWPWLAIGLAVALTVGACAGAPEPAPGGAAEPRDLSTPRPSLTPPSEPLDVVLAWIECEDQCAGAMQAVVDLGAEATPLLMQIVTEGPPPERVEAMQQHLSRAYEELSAYGRTHPEAALTIEQADYLGLYLGNYTALYQIRSAQALVAIGDPQAAGVLQRALRSSERPDVRAAIQEALRALGGQ
jgi:hypothetical protein